MAGGTTDSLEYGSYRVLLLSGSLGLSGSTTWILALQAALRRVGCPAIHIVVGVQSAVEVPKDATVYYTGRPRSHPLLRVARLLQLHKALPRWFQRASDREAGRRVEALLHRHGWEGGPQLVIKDYSSDIPSSLAGGNVVSVIHQMLSVEWQDKKLRDQGVYPFHYVAVSQAVAEDARSLGVDVRTVISNPLDAGSLQRRAQAFEVEEGAILYLGALQPAKGVMELLEAYAIAGLRVPLCIVGSGPLEAALRQRVEELQLQGRVRMAGFQANPYPFIAGASLLVLPSRSEAMPYACFEAALLDTPFLVRDFRSAAEFFQPQARVAMEPEASFIPRLASRLADAVATPCPPAVKPAVLASLAPETVARAYLALL